MRFDKKPILTEQMYIAIIQSFDLGALERYYQQSSILLLLAKQGFNNAIEAALLKGCNINAAGALCETALHKAAKGGHIDTVEFLLDQGCIIRANSFGDTYEYYLNRVRTCEPFDVLNIS